MDLMHKESERERERYQRELIYGTRLWLVALVGIADPTLMP